MKLDIVRAWKDESYRQSLSEEDLKGLPVNPAGELELTELDLLLVSGGAPKNTVAMCPPVPKEEKKSLLNIIKVSNIHLFSVNILANPLFQNCTRID